MGGMRNIVPSKQEHEDDDSTLNTAVSHALRTFMRETIKAPNINREWIGVMGWYWISLIKRDLNTVTYPSYKKIFLGILGFSKDRLPLVGDLRHVLGTDQGKGQYIAAGFTGHGKLLKLLREKTYILHVWFFKGMPRTFLCGRALAQLLTGQQPEDWFPTEFFLEHPSRASWWNSSKL